MEFSNNGHYLGSHLGQNADHVDLKLILKQVGRLGSIGALSKCCLNLGVISISCRKTLTAGTQATKPPEENT